MYISISHIDCDHRDQKRAWFSWKLVFWPTMWLLVIESGSPGRTASAGNHCVISPAPKGLCFSGTRKGFESMLHMLKLSLPLNIWFAYVFSCLYPVFSFLVDCVFPEQFLILKSFVAFLVRVVVIFKSSLPTFSSYDFAHVLS